MKSRSLLVAISVLLWAFPALAQNANTLVGPPSAAGSLSKGDAEYRLGPGDLIEVGVFGVEEFRHTIRLNASGVIKLPLLDSIEAGGLTPAELEQRLTTLLEADVIKDPHVSVFVKEYRSQPVYVLGSVKNPGQYQITTQMHIVEAISMAGGLQQNAVGEAVIQRPLHEGGEQLIKVDLAELLEKGDLSRNVVVKGGDVIHIAERLTETVYVVGEVNRSGAFAKPAKQELRVSQVIAWAGGATKTAKLSKGILIRYNEQGGREQLPVDIGQILKGKREDFFVKANDVIFVPGSRIKDIGLTMLNGIPGTLTTIPYALIP